MKERVKETTNVKMDAPQKTLEDDKNAKKEEISDKIEQK